MKRKPVLLQKIAFLMVFMGIACAAYAAECIVPAKPRGGFDLTCSLLQSGLALAGRPEETLKIVRMPGGVGAVGFNAIISRRPAEPDTLVAFSGGSLLNIAQGGFGRHTEKDVRWLAAIGVDYGVLVVRSDSPLASLENLVAVMRRTPEEVVFGGSGTTGGQDWMKLAMLAHAANVRSDSLRFVGFEGGGEGLSALLGRYVDVVSGDLSEAIGFLRQGMPLRILAVFSRTRLPGMLADVPTAIEKGFHIEWSNIRGVYMGPHVSDAEYRRWVGLIDRMLAHPAFTRMREETGLQPYAKTGDALAADVASLVSNYRCIAAKYAGTIPPSRCSWPPDR
jgi:putative tricarboxylic transport membrane protein